MDRFEQFSMAIEGIIISTSKSLARYEKYLNTLKTKFKSQMDAYKEVAKDIEELDDKMDDANYAKDKDHTKAMDAIVNKLYYKALTFDPMDLIKIYRMGVQNTLYRADRKTDAGKRLMEDAKKAFDSPDGEMYKLAKECHERMYGANKHGTSTEVRKRYDTLVTLRSQQQLQYQHQMFIMQQQQALQMHLQAVDMHNQMQTATLQQHMHMGSMGMF